MARPRAIETPEEFDRLVDDYVAQCAADEEPLTITGLSLALGFADKSTLYDYGEYEGFSHSVKRARAIVENAYEKRLSGNAATGAIFALKNFGWRDRQELEHSGRDGGPIELTDTERAAKLSALLDKARKRADGE